MIDVRHDPQIDIQAFARLRERCGFDTKPSDSQHDAVAATCQRVLAPADVVAGSERGSNRHSLHGRLSMTVTREELLRNAYASTDDSETGRWERSYAELTAARVNGGVVPVSGGGLLIVGGAF